MVSNYELWYVDFWDCWLIVKSNGGMVAWGDEVSIICYLCMPWGGKWLNVPARSKRLLYTSPPSDQMLNCMASNRKGSGARLDRGPMVPWTNWITNKSKHNCFNTQTKQLMKFRLCNVTVTRHHVIISCDMMHQSSCHHVHYPIMIIDSWYGTGARDPGPWPLEPLGTTLMNHTCMGWHVALMAHHIMGPCGIHRSETMNGFRSAFGINILVLKEITLQHFWNNGFRIKYLRILFRISEV